jgi:hypothetical protein
MLARKSLLLLLIAAMAFPGYGSPVAIGVVQGSTDSQVRGINLVPGTTLYSGDVVQVGSEGSTQISFGGSSELVLLQNSRAQVTQTTAKSPVQIDMQDGFAKFRSSSTAPIVAMLGDATIRAANGNAVGAIKITGSDSALISAEKGSLVVTTAGDAASTTVPEGMALNVALAPDAPAGTTANSGTSKRKKLVAGLLIIGAAAGIGAALALNEPTNEPSLSPFVP